MDLSLKTDPNQPYTRRSFSDMFVEGRQWLSEKMLELGLEVSLDCAGNLIGKRAGKNHQSGYPHTIAIGSHSDSVPSGGRYDGIAGVIAGLECVASLNDKNIALEHDLEIIDFLAEEPSEWGVSCIGSRGISGFLDEKTLQLSHPQTGEKLGIAINRMGGDSAGLKKATHIKAFFELHIEQGKVLETLGMDIGIVSSIVGIMRIEVSFLGESNHAGTTPMNMRKDAGRIACEMSVLGNILASEISKRNEGYFVATCGQIFFKPNASNVICGASKIVFDVRSDSRALMEEFRDRLLEETQKISKKQGILLQNFEVLSDTRPTYCDRNLMGILEGVCKKDALPFMVMPSGAGHDSAFMSHLAPVAMIFVPSQGGKSHCPEEYTSKEELGNGVNVLFKALLEYDKQFINS
ncbi:hypothetical protein BKH45_02010 [Helicobacter sp. 11S03491-1]|nr:hypothetical protein BKH45_02010 [Helicobacter sp. 11S03491-1]